MEALTSALCLEAWKLFQEIEDAGGPAEALRQGLVQSDVAEARAAREKAIARRKDSLIGTSDFPDLAEAEITVLKGVPPAPCDDEAERTAEPLQRMRLSELFEALRDRSDSYRAAHGARPKIFLACLGRPADFDARASFAKSLFEAGGIEAIAPQGAQSSDDMLKAFKASGASLVCLCSSDKVYASGGADAARQLREAGAKHIYLAGKPGELEAELKSAGVERFVAAGADALETLRGAYANLGA